MNAICLWSRQIVPFCRACGQVSFFREAKIHIMRFSSMYQSRYNSEEQNKILRIINDSSAEDLSRFDITKSRINSLQQFRRKRGPFCTLEEVLEVDGLGVKVLEKLCDSILGKITVRGQYYNCNESEIKNEIKSLITKTKTTQILIPAVHEDQIMKMQSAVGIHIGVCAVTWAQMDRNGKILAWDIYSLDFGSKRLHTTFLFDVARYICDIVPKGDIYILEDKVMSAVASKQQEGTSISVNMQNYLLTAMFLSLLNGSLQSLQNEPNKYEHTVFFLRSHLPARLFKTLIGSERVSAQSVVLDILSNQTASYKCSPICVSDELKRNYLNRTAMEKENLCWSLLLIMTFMELIVFKNNALALKNITNGRNK